MKRALSAAMFGGLLALSAPQVAFADHEQGRQDQATQPETTPQPERTPPPGQPYGDAEQHDDEETHQLF